MCSGCTLLVSVRTTIVNSRHIFVSRHSSESLLSGIPVQIGNNYALGILAIKTIFILAADGRIELQSIFPINLPDLIRSNCFSSITNCVIISSTFNSSQSRQKTRILRGGVGCLRLKQTCHYHQTA